MLYLLPKSGHCSSKKITSFILPFQDRECECSDRRVRAGPASVEAREVTGCARERPTQDQSAQDYGRAYGGKGEAEQGEVCVILLTLTHLCAPVSFLKVLFIL